MRIIGGQWKRSRLPVPDSPGLRPTPDRVRETLFNWLGQDLRGWQVLDAYAGSGALGFEAASRGAAEVTLLEQQPALVAALNRHRERLGATMLRIERADALDWMQRAEPGRYQLVLLDPPFAAGLVPASLQAARPLLAPGGLIYLESGEAPGADELRAAGLSLHRQGRAGAVHYHLLVSCAADATPPTSSSHAARSSS
ncbi:16S rRNA (guanine(966)-N(2))-methyltransferase RsmD [Sphaerotilus hippei]|uniref:16S rRNA (Guanine(966)-N(2))-methyltransferase RsmD n=1 Tax=Sphaerotilus hippei TaxID=744406 RepID=A0A318GWW8_9BURK|nr:16S rRNA (guanine(966)-N(2))-methyltransferase RsmD [Sphaerotilus hippei]